MVMVMTFMMGLMDMSQLWVQEMMNTQTELTSTLIPGRIMYNRMS